MSNAPILVGAGEPPGPDLRPSPDIAWRLLGTTGAAFAVVSLTDLALVWVPPHFGDGAWVLDTVGAVFAGMPLLALGLALMLVSAVVLNRPLLLRLLGWVLIVLATVVLAALGWYLRSLAAAGPDVRTAQGKDVIRVVCQGLAYALAFVLLGMRGVRPGPNR